MSNEITIKLIGNYSYQTSHCLGEGVYGKVYEGKDDQTKERVAIKKIDLNTFTNDKYLENAIFSEIYLLKRFNHTNIVRFKDVLTSKNSLYIITEFCKSGDLREIIKRRRFKEEEAFEVVRQILSGFTQLVQEKIIHRDLKPANILVNEGVYKIADFGFAKYVDNFGTQMLKSCVGSPIYMAPQILERAPYTTKCDIWSIGIIFY
jgi:serine/threonine-protein kinase ULK/ATG1